MLRWIFVMPFNQNWVKHRTFLSTPLEWLNPSLFNRCYNHRRGNRHTQAHRATTLIAYLLVLLFILHSNSFFCCFFFTVPFISLTDLNRKQHANRKVRNCIKSAKMYSFKRRYIHPDKEKKKIVVHWNFSALTVQAIS